MSRPIGRTLAAATLALLAVACQQTAGVMPSASGTSADGAQPTPTAAQFSDVFIPPGAKLYVERTLVFGQNPWYGQVALGTSGDPNVAFEQYRRDMPGFGWQEITSIRAPTSILTYVREDRVATVQITGGRLSGADVLIVVSPKGGTTSVGGGMGGGAMAPVSSGPVSPAPVQRPR